MKCTAAEQFFTHCGTRRTVRHKMKWTPPAGVQNDKGESAMIYQRSCAYPQQTFAPRQSGSCPSQDALPALPENPVVAMAYVPFQTDNSVYDAAKALQRGTAFPVLDKPFLAGCMQ